MTKHESSSAPSFTTSETQSTKLNTSSRVLPLTDPYASKPYLIVSDKPISTTSSADTVGDKHHVLRGKLSPDLV